MRIEDFEGTTMDSKQELTNCLKAVSDDLDGDIFLYSGSIDVSNVDKLLTISRSRTDKRPNVALILTTFGGDPDDGYRLARFLKRSYKKVTVFVFGYCKSAGTLVALGADEIVMSDFGELGPLDIQLLKDDELTRTSSLSYYQALLMLRENAYEMFETHFLELKGRSGGGISTKTAADIGTALTIGILAPIASQIDPLRLGEVGLSSQIAIEYGSRICNNLEAIIKLANGYPSHGFAIDLEEAQEVLKCVRQPSDLELAMEKALLRIARAPGTSDVVQCLYPKENAQPGEDNEIHPQNDKPKAGDDHTGDSEAVEQNAQPEDNSRLSIVGASNNTAN